MIRNPSIKQLLQAEKEGKSVLCNICSCNNTSGGLHIQKIPGLRPMIKHYGNGFSLAFRLKGKWRWSTHTKSHSFFNPRYWLESRKMRRSIIILP